MTIIYLPKHINFINLNNKTIYIYNQKNYIHINTKYNNLFFNKFLNIIKIKNFKNNKSSKINQFIFLWTHYLFSKIYFTGKGFKIKKNRNNTTFNFNHSHKINYINQKSIIKKIQKNKLLIFYKTNSQKKNIANNIINIKPASIYTKRGLRLSKTIILKKKN